ncbi:formyl transferase [Paenibacillus sp. MY03]|uniref:formyltransferase family protein n=1 Tax=Paenibacillus sp. MY03 TaxID=302980 RepID=UPI000B560B23|nr:formyltransferase family protein [Paenibacillus sp. MY03]OUS75126.1 formyl transferase [Paenibacillus sp. MY03]
MNICLLGPNNRRIIETLQMHGDRVWCTEERILLEELEPAGIEFIVSYKYRYLIRQPILEKFERKLINLHISYLPWNRGADPNLWSFLEDTPKGVTIHYIDSGLDTGDIIAQKMVEFSPQDTLKTSYEHLTATIEDLFLAQWPSIRSGKAEGTVQPAGGSYHRTADKQRFAHLLTDSWETPIERILGKGQISKTTEG